MYRYFTARNTRRYVDVLPDLLYSYNHTYHRSIGMAPVEVDDTNERLVRTRLYPLKPKSYKGKYDVGESTTSAVQKGISRSMVRRDFCDRRASVHRTSHLQTKRSGAVCTTWAEASLGVSPMSVVVSLGLATYARRYARRRRRPGVTSPGLPHAGKFPTSGFPRITSTAHA